MSSANGSHRPSGCVSIPVEIIREPTLTNSTSSHSRHNSPFRTNHDNSFGSFSNSPPWSSHLNSRIQPRQSPSTAYDRLITNPQFNQPFDNRSSFQTYEPQTRHPQQKMYETGPSHFSRSSEDLLSSPFDSMRYNAQPQYSALIPPAFGTGLRNDSDFVQPNRYSNLHRRSFDALNDFPDMRHQLPNNRQYPSDQQQQQPQPQPQQQPYYRSTYQTQHQPQQPQQQPTYVNQTFLNPNIVYTDERGISSNRYEPNKFQGTGVNIPNDQSRSPTFQRGGSPARPQPQQEEPELKMAKDTIGAIPMPAPASCSSSSQQSNDEQIPTTDNLSTTTGATPVPESAPDSNAKALEKLEQIKQCLDDLEREVDSFTGSTQNDRQYKILDERGLKIMLRCDELTDVGADIRDKRKEMIRSIQKVIGKLEKKVSTTSHVENNSNLMETANNSIDTSSHKNNEEKIEKKSSPSTSPSKENTSNSTTTEQPISA